MNLNGPILDGSPPAANRAGRATNRVQRAARAIALLLLAAIAPSAWAHAQGAETAPRLIGVDVSTLPNGLRVWIQPAHGNGEAHVRLVVQAGSGAEPEDGNGVAHFVEHMLFDHETDPTIHGLIQRIEMGGGYYNAFTTVDMTYAVIDAFESDLDLSLELLATSLAGGPFTPEQIEIERQILQRELTEKQDDALLLGVREQLYSDQSVAKPEGGSTDSVSRISARQLKAFFQAHYRPPAMVLVVVLDRPTDQVRVAVNRAFGRLAWDGQATPPYPAPERNPGPIQVEDSDHTGTLLHGFVTPGARDTDYPALWVLQELLEIRLYDRIRVQGGMSYAPYVYFTPNRHEGLLYLYASAEEASFAAMADAFDRELARVAGGEVPADEVSQARLRVSNRFLREHRSPEALADHLAWLAAVLDPTEVPQDPIESLRHITRRDVKRVAERWGTSEGKVDARTVPAPPEEAESEIFTRIAMWGFPAAIAVMLWLQIWTLRRVRRLRQDPNRPAGTPTGSSAGASPKHADKSSLAA